MFDQLKNLGNIGQLMARAGEMKQKMQELQEELGRKQVDGDAGAGMVTAAVNGRLELIKLHIERERLRPHDPEGKTPLTAADFEMLEDLICAAVRAAQNKAGEMMKAEMAKMAGDMGLPPGMLPGA